MKTFLGRVKVTLTLVYSGMVPRISFNMVAEQALHGGTIIAEKTEKLARRDHPRGPAPHSGDLLVNMTNRRPDRTIDQSHLEKGEERTGDQLEYPVKVREHVPEETLYQLELP